MFVNSPTDLVEFHFSAPKVYLAEKFLIDVVAHSRRSFKRGIDLLCVFWPQP